MLTTARDVPHVLQPVSTWGGGGRLLGGCGHDSQVNRQVLQASGLQDSMACKAKPEQTAKSRLNQRSTTIDKTRAQVEHLLASLAQQSGKCWRAMALVRNALAITRQCAAYNAR